MIKIQCVAHQLQVPKQFPKTQIDTEKSLQITLLFSRSVISDSATPGTVLYHLPEFAQTPVHWVSDAAQPPHHVTPFSFCPQSFPASGSFPMNTDYLLGKCPRHFSLDQTLRSGDPHHGFVHQECPDSTSPHSFPNICVRLCSLFYPPYWRYNSRLDSHIAC